MKNNLCLLVILFLMSVFTSCSRQQAKEISLNDKDDVIHIKADEVRLEDSTSEKNSVGNSGEVPQNSTQPGIDNSQISVMYDRYGNKVETRSFRSHARVASVIVTRSADGKTNVKVYGQSGEEKTLPPEMIERAMSARADEIANAAGLFAGRPMRITYNSASKSSSQTTSGSGMQIKTLPPIRLPEQTAPPVKNEETENQNEPPGNEPPQSPEKQFEKELKNKLD